MLLDTRGSVAGVGQQHGTRTILDDGSAFNTGRDLKVNAVHICAHARVENDRVGILVVERTAAHEVPRPASGRDGGSAPEDVAVQGKGAAAIAAKGEVIAATDEKMVCRCVIQVQRGAVVDLIGGCEIDRSRSA